MSAVLDGEQVRQRRARPRRRRGRHRDDRRPAFVGRSQAVVHGHDRQADEQDAQEHGHDRHRVRRVLRLRWLEGRDAVGDRLDAGQGHRSAGERLEQEQDADDLGAERNRVGGDGTGSTVPDQDASAADRRRSPSARPTNT